MKLKSAPKNKTQNEPDFKGKVGPLNEYLEQNPGLFPEFYGQMLHNPDYKVRLRAGNAVEKAVRKNPELLKPYKNELLALLPTARETEIIWHVALLLSYLELEDDDLALAVNKLYEWLDTVDHKFVKVNCLQSLAILAQQNSWLKPEVIETLKGALEAESAAIKARARILLKKLEPGKKR